MSCVCMVVLQDIVAVGYGGFSDKDAVQGVVCCWSLKNPEVLTPSPSHGVV